MLGTIKIGILGGDNCPACFTQDQQLKKEEIAHQVFKIHTPQGKYFSAVLKAQSIPIVFYYREHGEKSATFNGAYMHSIVHSFRAGLIPVAKIVKKLGELK